jgi:hypothetical protein
MDCSESDSEDDEGGEQCGDPEDNIEATVLNRTGFAFAVLFGLEVSDRAGLGVAKKLHMEESEDCMMHDGDKPGASATGKLTSSKLGIVTNPCVHGRELVSRAHKMAAYFSYGARERHFLISQRESISYIIRTLT